ncbi:MAG: CoA pyrophosphatase [Pseudomonadales bacterium]
MSECSAELRSTMARRLTGFALQPNEPAASADGDAVALRSAAVVIGVTELGFGAATGGLPTFNRWQSDAAVLLTRRSARLRNHPGQWAFPGGRVDPGETLEQAALRELAEEVGLQLMPEAVLGRLDSYVTASGFEIAPIVVWLGAARDLQLSPDEVASAHRIPCVELLREDAPRLSRVADSEHPVLRMPIGDDAIAAPTAAMLYQFSEVCLRDRATRVSHFAQPHFARR